VLAPLSINVTLENGLVSRTEFDYAPTNLGAITTPGTNVIARRQYDWGSGSPGPLLRTTTNTYLHDANPNYLVDTGGVVHNIADKIVTQTIADGAGHQAAQATYTYDSSALQSALAAPGHDDTNYGAAFTLRGNLTHVVRSNTLEPAQSLDYSYDILGNPRSFTVGKGTTQVDYTDSFEATPACPPASGNGQAYPTKITNALGQSTLKKYDSCSGQIAAVTDPNNHTTSYSYDGMLRLLNTTYPDGGGITNQYNSGLPFSVSHTAKMNGTLNLQTTDVYDGLGRLIQQVGAGGAITDTTYDGAGHIASVSHPHCSTSSPTDGISSYAYDALDRTTRTTQPDGSSLIWTYSGNVTDTCDETSRHWRRTSDALGRLTKVFEPDSANSPTIETDYQYDALNNLLRVDQWGGPSGSAGDRQRTFTYDSLSRLITASNPETGTICYGVWSGSSCINGYDAAGNLLARTDARGITTTFTYDALNRMTQKQAPGINYGYLYDAASSTFTSTNAIGRMTEASNGTNASQQI
jgi:YD repeat-containing protein